MIKVTKSHMRQAGFCASGFIAWAKSHNLDYKVLLRDGVDVEILEALHDGFADKVVALARKEAGQ